jgi:hypothetical protein
LDQPVARTAPRRRGALLHGGDGCLWELGDVLRHRGQPAGGERGRGRVIEADHRAILRHAQAKGGPRRIHQAERHLVIGAEHRIRSVVLLQKARRGVPPAEIAESAGLARCQRQPVCGEASDETAFTLGAGRRRLDAGEERMAAITRGAEQVGDQASAADMVRADERSLAPVLSGATVDEDDRRARRSTARGDAEAEGRRCDH